MRRQHLCLLTFMTWALTTTGCERSVCPDRSAQVDAFWSRHHRDLLPPGITLCEGSATVLSFDFDPEPDSFADVIVIMRLESRGWVRINQSKRKSGRTYILEKGTNTIIVRANTAGGRTSVSYEWNPS